MTTSVDPCVVALLGRDDKAREQLRLALEGFGATVAHEGGAETTEEKIRAVCPTVLIVNLQEEDDEDALAHLQSVFDDASINVIFNDADVSQHLEGWDLARWARHLAAKVLGHDDTMPPPPPGAERLVIASVVVQEEQKSEEQAPVVLSDTMMRIVEGEESDLLDQTTEIVQESPATMAEHIEESLELDFASLEAALGIEDAPAPVRLAPTPELVFDQGFDTDTEVILDEVPAGLTEDISPTFAPMIDANDAEDRGDVASDTGPWSGDGLTRDGDSSSEQEEVVSFDLPETHSNETESLDFESDFSWSPSDSAISENEGSRSASDFEWTASENEFFADESAGLDEDVAQLAAQLEAMEAAATKDEAPGEALEGFDFDKAPESAALDEAADESETTQASTPDKSPLFDGLSLALDDEVLPPEPATEKPTFNFDGLEGLSLEPIEEAQEDSPAIDPLLAAMGLVEAPSLEDFNKEVSASTGIEHVIVLGASIGGPDAVRSFLAELPARFPAVILVVQHLESGYFERLAQQLGKASRLSVKLASAGMVTAPGEVLVIPASHHIALERNGRVVFAPHATPPHYTPSIDNMLYAVADAFGKDATAIIFSGMAGDAVEGAAYLTSKGGEVWGQDPSSCVVSSMVDGARARGVVEFVGSPRELAERCVAKLGR